MSPLTKLFVVLLVVLSLLTTSAAVVFVNTSENYKSKVENLQKEAAAVRNEMTSRKRSWPPRNRKRSPTCRPPAPKPSRLGRR